jgi:predicted DNA binding CopG/RHH family protein
MARTIETLLRENLHGVFGEHDIQKRQSNIARLWAEDGVPVASRQRRAQNIRLSSKDLDAIQKRALEEGLPYQTLIASLLHKYAAGRLKEV